MEKNKFRGKRVDNGEWVYGYYTGFNDFEKCAYITMFGLYGVKVEVVPESVSQYTELKDKNKKEIYVKDILKANNTFIFEVRCDGMILYPYPTQCTSHIEQWGELEHLGNIFDNPELLKGK